MINKLEIALIGKDKRPKHEPVLVEDEVDEQREEMIVSIEERVTKSLNEKQLFTIKWSVM